MGRSRFFLKIPNTLRALLWRTGRRLYCFARGDFPNHPETNGEYWLLDQLLKPDGHDFVIFDVGANKGDWTVRALDVAERSRIKLAVYAFEPSSGSRALLTRRLLNRESVKISASALSSFEGHAYFYSNAIGSGTNSLSEVSGHKRELVPMTTLDAFLAGANIGRVDMLKIDTEGFDFEVLKGGEKALSAGLIEVIQFEYNWLWLINHASLRDVFAYIKDKPYRLGKLVGHSIELFDDWHFEIDRYFENNYVLIRDGSRLLNVVKLVGFDESNCARRFDKALMHESENHPRLVRRLTL